MCSSDLIPGPQLHHDRERQQRMKKDGTGNARPMFDDARKDGSGGQLRRPLEPRTLKKIGIRHGTSVLLRQAAHKPPSRAHGRNANTPLRLPETPGRRLLAHRAVLGLLHVNLNVFVQQKTVGLERVRRRRHLAHVIGVAGITLFQ